jgi:hypothetical protein
VCTFLMMLIYNMIQNRHDMLLTKFRKNMVKFELFVQKIYYNNFIYIRFNSLYQILKRTYLNNNNNNENKNIANYFVELDNILYYINNSNLNNLNKELFSKGLNEYMNIISDINLLQNDDQIEKINNFFSELIN